MGVSGPRQDGPPWWVTIEDVDRAGAAAGILERQAGHLPPAAIRTAMCAIGVFDTDACSTRKRGGRSPPTTNAVLASTPACPRCNEPMVARVAKRGASTGSEFG